MAGETPITIIGKAVDEVDLRFTPSGAAVAKFRIASTPRIYDKQSGQWRDGEATFLKVECWRQLAEQVAETVTKGMRLIVHGALKPDNYETREGEKRFGFKIDAEEIGPSLKFASAKVNKMSRDSEQGSAGAGRPGGDPWSSAGADEQAPF